jgi:hypothetical protein
MGSTAQQDHTGKLSDTETIDLLFKKYSLLKSEVFLLFANYKRHTRYVQLVATALAALLSYLVVDDRYPPSDGNTVVWLFGLFVAISLISYFVQDTLDSIYNMNILGERMAQIERQINEIAQRNLLIWETEVVERVFVKGIPGVFAPYKMLQFYVVALLVAVLIVCPVIICVVFWNVPTTYIWPKRAFIIFDFLYSIGSAIGLICVAASLFSMREKVRNMLGMIATFPHKNSTRVHP